jgi:hypothetical protein
MWLEEDEGERINNLRADEVIGVSTDTAVVACPCLTMLKDGVDARGLGIESAMDISELLQRWCRGWRLWPKRENKETLPEAADQDCAGHLGGSDIGAAGRSTQSWQL